MTLVAGRVATLVTLTGFITVIAGTSAEQIKPPRQDYYSGAYLYQVYCANCHGPTGKGDGPAASDLRRPPGDLTTIATRAGGVFPRSQIKTVIDGRKPLPGHGSAEMPVWGTALRSTEGQDEAIISRRIGALVMHLESLQVKSGG